MVWEEVLRLLSTDYSTFLFTKAIGVSMYFVLYN